MTVVTVVGRTGRAMIADVLAARANPPPVAPDARACRLACRAGSAPDCRRRACPLPSRQRKLAELRTPRRTARRSRPSGAASTGRPASARSTPANIPADAGPCAAARPPASPGRHGARATAKGRIGTPTARSWRSRVPGGGRCRPTGRVRPSAPPAVGDRSGSGRAALSRVRPAVPAEPPAPRHDCPCGRLGPRHSCGAVARRPDPAFRKDARMDVRVRRKSNRPWPPGRKATRMRRTGGDEGVDGVDARTIRARRPVDRRHRTGARPRREPSRRRTGCRTALKVSIEMRLGAQQGEPPPHGTPRHALGLGHRAHAPGAFVAAPLARSAGDRSGILSSSQVRGRPDGARHAVPARRVR